MRRRPAQALRRARARGMCLKNKGLGRVERNRPAKRVWMVTVSNVRAIVGVAGFALAFANLAAVTAVRAETLESALVRAYQNNPQLNAQRASVRSIDEGVPQALSGYRPRVAITGTVGENFTDATSKTVGRTPVPGTNGAQTMPSVTYTGVSSLVTPWSYGATAQQTLFNGFQTANRTRAAESQVSSAREGLRILEQTVLLTAATTYMDVLRDTAALEVQRSNVRVLQETLKQTNDHFQV